MCVVHRSATDAKRMYRQSRGLSERTLKNLAILAATWFIFWLGFLAGFISRSFV